MVSYPIADGWGSPVLGCSSYRACRVQGATVRKLIDCLIAAVAVSADVEVLHADADVHTLARHMDLPVHPASLR